MLTPSPYPSPPRGEVRRGGKRRGDPPHLIPLPTGERRQERGRKERRFPLTLFLSPVGRGDRRGEEEEEKRVCMNEGNLQPPNNEQIKIHILKN